MRGVHQLCNSSFFFYDELLSGSLVSLTIYARMPNFIIILTRFLRWSFNWGVLLWNYLTFVLNYLVWSTGGLYPGASREALTHRWPQSQVHIKLVMQVTSTLNLNKFKPPPPGMITMLLYKPICRWVWSSRKWFRARMWWWKKRYKQPPRPLEKHIRKRLFLKNPEI